MLKHAHVLCEKPRTVHLKDWSHKSDWYRHVLWCVAYRILANGETKQSAITAVSNTLWCKESTLNNVCKKFIRIEYHEE